MFHMLLYQIRFTFDYHQVCLNTQMLISKQGDSLTAAVSVANGTNKIY